MINAAECCKIKELNAAECYQIEELEGLSVWLLCAFFNFSQPGHPFRLNCILS